MQEVKLTIVINRPVEEVFAFTTDPHNTPLWIDNIEEELTSQWPPQIGTIYKNRGKSDEWDVYLMSKYKMNEEFELVAEDGNYHVAYLFSPMGLDKTEMTYHEWIETEELSAPFEQSTLEKLKSIIENPE